MFDSVCNECSARHMLISLHVNSDTDGLFRVSCAWHAEQGLI